MSPDWPTLLGAHEKGVHEGSCCVLSKFTKHHLSLYLLLQFTELLKTPHTRPSASIRKQHGYFRNHTEWLKKQGTFQCLLEGSLGSGTICCFSFHPSKAQAERRSYPCQVALPLWPLTFSPFPVKGKRPLKCLPFPWQA